MDNFDKILLTFREKLFLFSLRFRKRYKGNAYAAPCSKLCEYGLIAPNYKKTRGSEGEYIPDGTFSLTDTYWRYCIYSRRERFHRYLTPIVVAFLTSIETNLLKELWLPVLLSWLRGQP